LKRFPTIADVNSDYDKEYERVHNRFAYLFHRATKSKSFRNVTGFTTLTSELASWLEEFKKPIAVIGDGINLDQISPLPPANNSVPRLVCFASKPFPWIALDKIADLAKACPDIKIDIIGLNKSEAGEHDLPENVIFHGFLSEDGYYKITQEADVAIGTLGLHRIGLQEMAPLKLREYLALGLPAIIAYKDTDFLEGAPYLLQLPNNENNISPNLDQIIDFIWKWKGKRVPQELIQHVDISEKERKRLDFIIRLVDESNRLS
jgi:glycosyltransferase involved in cell wall biosynthesis